MKEARRLFHLNDSDKTAQTQSISFGIDGKQKDTAAHDAVQSNGNKVNEAIVEGEVEKDKSKGWNGVDVFEDREAIFPR